MSGPEEMPVRGRSAVLGLMVVALTAGMFALAGTTPKGIGAPVDQVARVALDQRTFVCAGNLPGSTVTQGSVTGGPGPTQPLTDPLVINADRKDAASAYAAQSASAAHWTAWLPCPEAHARWWFVGAGGAVTHDTVLSITNPRSGAAVLDVTVYGPNGPVDAPGIKGIIIPAGGHRDLDLAKSAPANGELAVKVVARRGLVAISAADQYSPRQVGKTVREWVPGQSLPATRTNLVGLPAKPSGATLVVVNPGQAEAIARVEVIGATGTFAPGKVPSLTVAPGSVTTLPLSSVFDGTAVAIRVSSDKRVTATIRTTQGGDVAYATGVSPIRGVTAFAVPAGTQRQLALSSLGSAGTVTMTTYDAAGKVLATTVQKVPAGTTVGLPLAARVRSVQLSSDAATTVAGLFAVDPHGVSAAGVSPALRSIRLPVVRPGW